MVKCYVQVNVITLMAMMVNCNGEFIWLPLSQIEYEEGIQEGDFTDIYVPEWLAIEKEMI